MKNHKLGSYNYQPGESIPFLTDRKRTDSNGTEIPEMSISAKSIFDAYNSIENVECVFDTESNTLSFKGSVISGKILLSEQPTMSDCINAVKDNLSKNGFEFFIMSKEGFIPIES